ncbi:MAG: hypothetical protein ACYDCL_11330 [Myxococcales bacterium]
MTRRSAVLLPLLLLLLSWAAPARAFWLLGFSTADTQPQWTGGFIGGTGGQLTFVGDKLSFTPFLAHAGLRVGLTDWLDVGYRLCTVTLPYNQGGPVLGGQLDFKARWTPRTWAVQSAVGADFANAYLDLAGQPSVAWSPGAYLLVSRALSKKLTGTLEARYAYVWVPGASNELHSIGGSAGLAIALSPTVSVRPELGAFDFVGSIHGAPANGVGLQYGAVLAARAF